MNCRALIFIVVLPPAVVSVTFAQTTGNCAPASATADLDINNVRAGIYNNGGLFWGGSNPQYEVPNGGGAHSIFAAGLWIGGLVDGEIRTAGATYSDWEFWPGPLDAQGNPPADCSAFDRIFKVSRSDIDALDGGGQPTPDIADWPWQLGAPVLDGDGNPGNYDVSAGDRPLIEGDQMLWWIMNDAGNEHRGISELAQVPGDPIGLELQVSAFAFAAAGGLGNTTFYRYRITRRGSGGVDSLYFGIWSDPDVGNAGDDYVGSDSLRGLGFAYNGDDFDDGTDGYGAPPPAVAFDFLKGPTADADGVDNDYDGLTDEAGESLQMTSFVFYNGDATVMGNPVGPADHYNYLRARWRDGQPITFGGLGRGFSTAPTTMMYTGDPASYWSEEDLDGAGQHNVPSDRRFVMATGPVRLEPGQTEDIFVAVLWARGSDRLSSVALLKSSADAIQGLFDEGGLTSTHTNASLPPSANLLVQSYPNPFAATSRISVHVRSPSRLTIDVFDVLGRNVGSVYDGSASPGRHTFDWRPAGLPAGWYVYRVAAGHHSASFPVLMQP